MEKDRANLRLKVSLQNKAETRPMSGTALRAVFLLSRSFTATSPGERVSAGARAWRMHEFLELRSFFA